MPKTLVEIRAEITKREQDEKRLDQWLEANYESVEKRALEVLNNNPEKVFSPDELFEIAFGKKECDLQINKDKTKNQLSRDADHTYNCDFCRHFTLFLLKIEILNMQGKITIYELDENDIWIGKKP